MLPGTRDWDYYKYLDYYKCCQEQEIETIINVARNKRLRLLKMLTGTRDWDYYKCWQEQKIETIINVDRNKRLRLLEILPGTRDWDYYKCC